MGEVDGTQLITVPNKTVFSQLNFETREKILTKNVVFQGEDIHLRDLLTPSRGVDLDEIVDPDLISRLVNNEKITVGVPMDLLDKNSCHYYIRRRFDDEHEVLSDRQLSEYEESRWHEIITILDPPGSGKSTILDNIAVNLKKNYPYLWVIKIDLKNYSEAFSTFHEKKMKLVSIADLLNSRQESRINDGFEWKIFTMPRKIVLIIDGMDEVPPDYKEIVRDLMSDYHQNRNLARVYVASSNNMDESLESKFWSGTWSVTYSEMDRIRLLRSYLEKSINGAKDKEKLEIYAEKLVRQKWLVEDENALVGVPLQIEMLAEVVCGIENLDVETSLGWDDYYEFLSSGNGDLSMSKKISLARLYLLYIHRSCCKNKTSLNVDLLREDVAKLNEKYQYSLYVTALENVFMKKQCELFNCHRNRVLRNCEELLALHIVQKVGDQLRFSHRTQAEYFVADCIVSELCQIENKEFLTFFVEVILTRREFGLVRLFLDSLIGAVLNSISNNTLTDIAHMITENESTFVHYLLKEGCVEIFKFLLKCLNLSGLHLDFDVIRLQDETLLQTAISAGQFNILETLVELGASVKSRDDDERTALYSAVSKDDLKAVKFLVQHGAEVHCRDVTGRTPLHEAATSCSLDMMEFLLSQGAPVDCRDRDGCTPLHEAVKSGRLDRVEYLVQKGGDVNSKAKTGTPLFDAVSEGHLSIVKYLLEKGAKVTFRNEKGGTVLYKPSKYENYYEYRQPIKPQNEETRKNVVEIFKLLVDSGIDINAVDRHGNTALHSHIDSGDNVHLTKYLVENGVEVDRVNKMGESALDIAIRFHATQIVKYLVQISAPVYSKKLLYAAVDGGYLNVLKYFEEKGVDLNFPDERRYSLLHTALDKNDFNMVKYLVEKGVDINGKSGGRTDGITVIAKAINTCSSDIVKFLIESGANLEGTLELAAAKGDTALVKLLEDKGIKTDEIHGVGGNFALLQYLTEKGVKNNPHFIVQVAVENGDLNIIKYFIDRGIDIYMTQYDHTLVLHKAAKHDHIHIVKLLIKHGADIDYKDYKGETALKKAFRRENLEIAEYLVEKGADIKNVLGENREMLLQVIYSFDKVKFLVDHIEKINIYEEPEKSVFVAALERGCFEAAEYLVEKSEGNETIADVVNRLIETKDNVLGDIFKQWGTVRYLLEKGTCIGSEEIEKFNLLVKAASENDFKYVRYLVEKGADVNQKDEQSGTSLHETSDLRIVKYLIKKGADVNAKTNDVWSVLHKAVQSKNFDVCEFLVENGAKIDSMILYVAATKGTYNKVKYLLGRGVKFTIKESNKALRKAVTLNDFHLVECLIENGAEIEDRDGDDRTAIFKAVDSSNLDMVKYLAKQGANINVEDKYSTLFQHAVAKADLDIIRYLVSSGVDITVKGKSKPLLHIAASAGDFETVKFLLENGVNVATVDQDGRTVLHEAAKSGNSHLVEYLLNHGAPKEFEAKDKRGRTVLQESLKCEENTLRVLKVMVNHGADVNAKFEWGRTLLHEAMLNRNSPVAEFLVESGADVNAKTETGRTALLDAAAKGSLDLVRLLVSNGADVHVQDRGGYTALHEATRSYDYSYWCSNYVKVMEFLIENGATVDVKSREGRCPLEDAVAKFDIPRIKVLVENGAKLGPDSKNYKMFLEALQHTCMYVRNTGTSE